MKDDDATAEKQQMPSPIYLDYMSPCLLVVHVGSTRTRTVVPSLASSQADRKVSISENVTVAGGLPT